MLVRPGQLVEKRRFTAVLVASQRKMQGLPLGDLTACLAVVIAGSLAQFAHAGVGDSGVPCLAAGGAVRLVDVVYLNFGGVGQPQRQLVAAQFYFDRVPHGGYFAQGDFGTGGQAHIQQVVAQLPLPTDGAQHGILPDFYLCECHDFPSPILKV